MRVFAGLSLTGKLRDAIRRGWEEMDARARAQLRPVAPQNWHITLYFYGEIEDEMVGRIYEVYDSGCEGIQAVRARLGGWGGFPSAGKARVVWVGLKEGAEQIREIKQRLDEAHRQAGIPWDEKVFHPHITVGRAKQTPVRIEEKDLPPETDILDTIGVYRSTLTPAGAIYETLRVYKLMTGGAADG
jgi:2'-5' RNA ligase